jgi:uncharacterized damage-inducible protein DinB
MLSELANIREHWTRYRDVTLQHLDMLAEEQMAWRPQPELFSCGQHFVHILQTEKHYARGLFHHDWDNARLHFPASLPVISQLRSDFTTTRAQTLADFDKLTDANLDEVKPTSLWNCRFDGGSGSCWSTRSITRRSLPCIYDNSERCRHFSQWS